MSEQDRAISRACLTQVADGLCEARAVRTLWESLGSDVKMRWCDFQCDVQAIRVSLREVRAATEQP